MRSAALAGLTFLCMVVALPGPPVSAADASLTAQLTSFPAWVGPADVLTATFQVTNHASVPLSGLTINVAGYDGPGSRTALQNQMSGNELTQRWSDTISPAGPPLAPGETRSVIFDLAKPLSSYRFFTTPGAMDSAFPLRFTLTADRATTTIDTQLIYFQEARVDHPLQLSLVIPLDTPTVFDQHDHEVSNLLEDAIAPGGRIDRILAALEAPSHAELQLSLAPSGRLLSSLGMLAAGFTRSFSSGNQQVGPNDAVPQNAAATLARLRSLAARPGVVLIASPYANAPLAGLLANSLQQDAAAQVNAGRATMKQALGFDPLAGWLLPSDGLLDAPTLDQLLRLGVNNVVLSSASLESGAPPVLTPGAQVTVKGRTGHVPGLVEDGVLESRLRGNLGMSSVQIRQAFLAESATILLEQPGKARASAVVTPSDWDPNPAVINGILDALVPVKGSPWMTGTTPNLAIPQVTNPPSVSARQSLPPADADTPPKEYFDALRLATSRADDFAALGTAQPAGPEFQGIVELLSRRLLMAEGRESWGRGSASDRGRALARSVSDRVKAEFDKIQVRDQTITVTSRQAAIPLVLDSGVNYPVQVVIRLESDKLAFPDGQPCGRSPSSPATCLTRILLPRSQTIPVKATANFSGRFFVQVNVQTTTQSLVNRGQLVIRSTAYNVLALGIMAAAALFILVSWISSIVRRRVRARGHAGAGQADRLHVPPAPLEGQ